MSVFNDSDEDDDHNDNNRANFESHNSPLTEAEIRAVFSPPQFRLDTETGPGKDHNDDDNDENDHINLMILISVSSSGFSAQLCLLYYILLYEDIRQTNSSNKTPPRHQSYSVQLLNDLPLK